MSCEFECEKKLGPRRGSQHKDREQMKEARRKSKPAPKTVSTGGQELHPLIRVEDTDGHAGLHAASDSKCVSNDRGHSGEKCAGKWSN